MTDLLKNYLIETSAVPAAIGMSTEAHGRHFKQVVRDGRLSSSIYIRKEFIDRFICELADIAAYIRQRTSVKDALVLLSQRFGIRGHKVDIIAIGFLLERNRAMDNPQIASEEIARLAILWLKTFDKIFRNLQPNACGCLIGHKRPHIDYNTLLQDLIDFYEDFKESVVDCPVNEFVGIGDPTGRGQTLVADKTTQSLDSVENLARLINKGNRFACNECRKIGDAIIALEQPDDMCLVHIDKAFSKLCPFLNRENLPIMSAIAVDYATIHTNIKQPDE